MWEFGFWFLVFGFWFLVFGFWFYRKYSSSFSLTPFDFFALRMSWSYRGFRRGIFYSARLDEIQDLISFAANNREIPY
jgi:hypothetical protein